MKTLISLFMIISLSVSSVWAADKDGKFAAKGAARKTCSEFVQAKEKLSRDYLLFGGWLEGYITAYNQFQNSNYDITPWQTTELLLILMEKHCKSNPDTKILNVTNGLIQTLFPARLQQESKIVKLKFNNSDGYYYSEIIKQVKTRLKTLGFYNGDANNDSFSKKEISALRKFQLSNGLKETGMPDQYTLTQLFLRLKK